MTKKYVFQFQVTNTYGITIMADSAVKASHEAAKSIESIRGAEAYGFELVQGGEHTLVRESREVTPLTLKSIQSLPKCAHCSKDIQSGDLRVIMLDENVERVVCSACEQVFEENHSGYQG
jgi:hypothetical protein